ncbi:restriction endonuclease subunit S [Treponema berlinense]|uniref:restriction endonuclease subunit S n=1 Tax=Treponema berlinense TaxID=225004 RepID=UPI0026EE463A|nr:restriction endonuclease subunit S [Treponema berlinense]
MNEWKTVRLGDVATYINGYAFKPSDWTNEGLPIIRIQNLTGNDYETNYFNGELPEKYYIKNGDVLISWSASLGVYEWKKSDALLNQHIFKVVFNKLDVDKKYFMFTVSNLLNAMTKQTHGSTMRHITKPDFDNMEFPLPPLAEQKHIAAILDKTQKIIAEHKQMLQKYDTLIKSRFIEMFGDNNFQKKKWNEIFITKTGKLDSNAMVEDGEYPFFTCAKEVFKIDKYAFDQEALLLAGNNAAGKYDVKHYKGKFNAYQRTYVLSLKEEWEYPLFKYQLEDKLEYLRQQSLGGLTKYLTLKILETLDFIVPPIGLQKKFTTFVQQIDKSKSAVQKSLEKTETLYKSLMQQYFACVGYFR